MPSGIAAPSARAGRPMMQKTSCSNLRSWFFKIITRVFYSSIRKHFWKRFVPLDRNTIDIPEIFPRNEYNEERILLDNALSKLSAKERAAVLLYEIAGFSIEEIQHLQKENSLSAVKSRLSRARQKLRRHIKELENKGRNTAGAESQNKYFRGSEGFRGDIENETIKLVAELKAKE
jgi:RNA polymerase sigma factor (sigma-70 family)